jgi:DNA repair protein RadC
VQTYAIKPNFRFLDQPLHEYILTIRDLPLEQKPREKLLSLGPEALNVKELLAVVLNTGTKREDLMSMTDRIIRGYGDNSILSERNPDKLSKNLHIPIVKACQIVALGEMGRRFYERHTSGFTTIRNAKDVYEYLQDMRNLPKEHLRGLYLNGHNRIIKDEVISIGTINANMIHPREVFRPAIEHNAVALIIAHNHPSGEAKPSDEDINITRELIRAGKILGINLLDHIIITKDTFVSLNDSL